MMADGYLSIHYFGIYIHSEGMLITVIYADVLFLINFGMDMISLWLTMMIVRQKSTVLRLFFGAFIGGVFGVLSVLIGGGWLLSFLLSFFVSALMIIVVSSSKLKFLSYLKYTVILWGIGALIGGIVSAVCSLGGTDSFETTSRNAPFFILALGAALSSGVVRLISSFRSRKKCSITINAFGTTVTSDCLIDSGNLLKEPISGSPVMFVSRSLFKSASKDIPLLTKGVEELENLSPELKLKTRIVPVQSVGGEKIRLATFPDDVTIHIGKENKKVRCAMILEDTQNFGGTHALVPESII